MKLSPCKTSRTSRTSRTALAVTALALAWSAAAPASAQLKAPRNATPTLTAPAAPAPAPVPASASAPAAAPTDTAQKEQAGQLAALGWLLLLDRRDWGTAWESANQVFRTQVPIGTWMDAIPKVRDPLGPLTGREPLETAYKSELPGRPAGDYVTVVFASKFANRPDTQETVTTTLGSDGKWRVLGYSTR